MRKQYFWLIIAGITFIAAIVLAELIATIIYLHSPERVLVDTFQKLVDAKSFSFSLKASEGTENLSASLVGKIDFNQPTKPSGQSDFSFTMGDAYSVRGKLTAEEGKVYAKLDEAKGLPSDLAQALASWVGADAESIYLAATNSAISLNSYLSDADIAAIIATLKKHPLFRTDGKGDDELLESVYVVRYPVVFDKNEAILFLNDLEAVLKDQNISHAKFKAARLALSGNDSWPGEVWVAKNDGTLRAAHFGFPAGDGRTLNVSATVSDYNKKVSASPPVVSAALPIVLRNLYLPTLSANVPTLAEKLPFPTIVIPLMNPPELPAQKNVGLNLQAPPVGGSGAGGGVIDFLLRLIYGSNPFAEKKGVGSVFNVNTQINLNSEP